MTATATIRDVEVLELLDNWTDKEVREQARRLVAALAHRERWEQLSRAEKDALWEKAE